MSRISPLRSSTCTPNSSLRTRICEGERSLSKMTIVASCDLTSSRISSTLPSPMNVCRFGDGSVCKTTPTLTPPAVSTSAPSSSRLSSSAFSFRSSRGDERPTKIALSRGALFSFNSSIDSPYRAKICAVQIIFIIVYFPPKEKAETLFIDISCPLMRK